MPGPCWQGVGGDWQSAFAYFNVAADGGHVDAKFDLAMCYLKGRGIHQDREGAMRWLHDAAAAGHDTAKRMTRA